MADPLDRAKELYREFMTLLRPWEQRLFRQILKEEPIPLRREVELMLLFRLFAVNHWESRVRTAPAQVTAG
jgi:hypothetical protein